MSTLRIPIPRMTARPKLIDMALDGAEYRGWYKLAHEDIQAAAPLLACTPQYLADTLALFSPRVSVLRSIRWSILWLRSRTYAHDTTRSHKLAMEYYQRTGKIRGPKTAPFARAIMGDSSAIVLDTWMGVALGVDPKRWEIKAVWNVGAERVRHVAKALGWQNAEAQAAIWASVVRRERASVPMFPVLTEAKRDPGDIV